MPDAALVGYEVSSSVGARVLKLFGGSPLGQGAAVATSLISLLGGVDILLPFSSPRLWIYGYAGFGIGIDTSELEGLGDSLSIHVGLVWNAKTPNAYRGPFFCNSLTTSSVNVGQWGFPVANLSVCSSRTEDDQ